MSSYFDEASLVMIPSGYKDQKVYSVKPLDGSGDLTFSRASSATRVASNGLIEKVRTNITLQSQNFTTTWNQNASPTITANTTVAPDGTTTADTIAATASFSGVYQSFGSVNNATEYSWSVYIKNISSASNIFVGVVSNPSTATLNFDATTGTIIGTGGSITGSSVTNVGNGWYRLSGTYVSTGTTTDFAIYGIGVMSFAAWGAQLETGVTTDYIATTSAAVSVGPVSGLPRLDYLGSSCPRLLLEPQRTNLITFSESFDNAAWTKNAVSVTANNAVSPDGYTNADLITADGTNTQHYVLQTQTQSAKTISFFVKMGTQRFVQILTSGSAAAVANYDLQTGAVGGLGAASTASMVDYGNGWWRLILTSTDALTGNPYLCYADSLVDGRFPSITSTGTIWAWGAMAEAGATYATSYIPTLGTSVTRVADGTGTSDVFGTTYTLDSDFGLYWEGVINGNNSYPFFYSGGNYAAGSDYRSYFTYTGTNLRLFGVGEALTGNVAVSLTAGTYYKILVKRVGSTIKWYVNGTEYANASGFTTTTVKMRSLFGSTLGGPNHESVAKALIFETTLSDAQGIELTTL
jgi:hypothetical protein